MATMELARVDASCATYYLVHTFLAMLTVALMVRTARSWLVHACWMKAAI
jgi:hypothetical protein